MKVKKVRRRMNWSACKARTDVLREELGREVRAHDVLADAVSSRSPYHNYFTWDDSKAAEKQRLWEARHLLAHIKIIYKDEDGNKVSVRKYVRLMVRQPHTHELAGGYVPRPKVQDSDYLLRQAVTLAAKELETWKNRWRTFQQIEPAFPHINAAILMLERVVGQKKIVAS